MYIITGKTDNAIKDIGNAIEYMVNGYPKVIDSNTIYPNHFINLFEISEVPQEIKIEKYCYTEADGFYINPNYVEPDPTNTYGISDETYHAIINDLTEEVANSGY